MSQRKLHEEIQDLKDQLKNRDEEVKVEKSRLNQSTTVKLDDTVFAWWNGPANISLTNNLSKKYQ